MENCSAKVIQLSTKKINDCYLLGGNLFFINNYNLIFPICSKYNKFYF